MHPSILIQAWPEAAQDLGIEIIVPFVLTLKNGETVRADLLVKDFGPTLVITDEAEETLNSLGDELGVEGYGYSAFCGEELVYDRDLFIDTLNDWGWTGPGNRRPNWAK
jgi:hypothetical protein